MSQLNEGLILASSKPCLWNQAIVFM